MIKGIALIAMCATLTLLITNCSHDEVFGLEKPYLTEDPFSSSSLDDVLYESFLSISSKDVKKWDEKDYISCDIAINRLGVVFCHSKNKYVYNDVSYDDINISESLYNCVLTMLERTNSIIASTEKPVFARVKTRSNESSGPLPDCVPAAIAHMGQNAPTYNAAILKCDELFPTWRTSGGVPPASIESFIEVYTPVTEQNNLNIYPEGVTLLPKLVMVFESHAVNATRVFRMGSSSTIHYEDHSSQSLGDSFILGSEMSMLFTFDN